MTRSVVIPGAQSPSTPTLPVLLGCALVLLVAPTAARAQRIQQPSPAPQHAPSALDGAVPWFEWGSAVPSGAPMRTGQTATLDLRTGSDESITVYGRRKTPDFHTREQDHEDARWVAPPPIGGELYRGSTSCARAAYDTVAGQPATGLDMIGARC